MAKRRRRLREDLTEEDIRRLKKRRKQRKIRILKRRIYACLFLLIAVVVAVFIFVHRGRDNKSTVSENGGMPTSGAADSIGSANFDGNYEEVAPINNEEQEYDAYKVYDSESIMRPNEPLDVTRGYSALSSSVSENGSDTEVESTVMRVMSAKAAMAQASYFPGTTRTVNDYLSSYGEGAWHGIEGVQGQMCIFYEGVHITSSTYTDVSGNTITSYGEEEPFKVNFIVYEDGSFIVQGIENAGVRVDDYKSFLEAIVRNGNA